MEDKYKECIARYGEEINELVNAVLNDDFKKLNNSLPHQRALRFDKDMKIEGVEHTGNVFIGGVRHDLGLLNTIHERAHNNFIQCIIR